MSHSCSCTHLKYEIFKWLAHKYRCFMPQRHLTLHTQYTPEYWSSTNERKETERLDFIKGLMMAPTVSFILNKGSGNWVQLRGMFWNCSQFLLNRFWTHSKQGWAQGVTAAVSHGNMKHYFFSNSIFFWISVNYCIKHYYKCPLYFSSTYWSCSLVINTVHSCSRWLTIFTSDTFSMCKTLKTLMQPCFAILFP